LDPTIDLKEEVFISTEIFRGNTLSILESVVRFFKDIKKLNFHEIGLLLKRDERNIWTVYSRSKKKIPEFSYGSKIDSSDIIIPISVFHDENFCVLETLSVFLKDSKLLNYHQIGLLLGRDERNIWTVYNRAKKKTKNAE